MWPRDHVLKQLEEMLIQVFSDVFDVLPRNMAWVPDSKKSLQVKDSKFALIEQDFTFGGQKIAGNAQAISRHRWVHHTSFLWDYNPGRMALLKEPEKRPEYRGNRKHSTFLTPLIALGYKRSHFVEGIEDALASRGLEIEPAGLHAASLCMKILARPAKLLWAAAKDCFLLRLSCLLRHVLLSAGVCKRENCCASSMRAFSISEVCVGDHEYACMHDLMMHLRNEPRARYSNVHDAFDI
jgi:hypothetical protein